MTGSLTGTVYCADTNLPARGAQITLFHISENSLGGGGYGETDLEGRFSLSHVAEGDYYVFAALPGYVNLVSSFAQQHLMSMTAEEREKLLAQALHVTISAGQTSQISVRLERGAEIDGNVNYDDGSPAIGLRVGYKLKTADSEASGAQAHMMDNTFFAQIGQPMTDDRGHFRILGVPPGKYLVHVMVPTRSSQHAEVNRYTEMIELQNNGDLKVYVGGAFRASKAEVINVDAGAASRDADITIPLSKLHTIRGQVVLKSTGRPPVTANVRLLYADTKEEIRSVLAPDGRFEIFYVPEESYLVRAAAGAEAPPAVDEESNPETIVASTAQRIIWRIPQAGVDSPGVSVQVTGDVENLTIAVPDPRADKKGPTLEIGPEGVGFSSTVNPEQ
jgi:hypothetical protein